MTLDIVVAASLLVALASVAASLMTRASAASRHAVWTAALLAVIAMPAARALLPAIEVPVLVQSMPVPTQPQPVTALESSENPQPANALPVAVTPSDSISAIDVAATIWLAGVSAAALWYAAGTIGVWRLSRRSTRGPASLHESAKFFATAAGVTRAIRVRISADDRVPMTWGLLRPTILLPAGSSEWPAERLDAVLAHELAHAARFDVVAHRIGRIATALYWFNPLVWFAMRQAQLERERACDDLVLSRGSLASTYAGELVAFARSLSAPAAVLPMARRSRLEARVMAILDPRTNRKGTSVIVAMLAAAVVLIAVVGSVIKLSAYNFPAPPEREIFQAVPPPPPPPPPPPEPRMPPPPPPAAPPMLQSDLRQVREAQCEQDRAQAATDGWDMAKVHIGCEPGVVMPVRTREAKPLYTPEAMRQKIEGTVTIMGVVDEAGIIRDVRVTGSLDTVYGLDLQAMHAVRAMAFLPGTLRGQPTQTLVKFELQFRLR